MKNLHYRGPGVCLVERVNGGGTEPSIKPSVLVNLNKEQARQLGLRQSTYSTSLNGSGEERFLYEAQLPTLEEHQRAGIEYSGQIIPALEGSEGYVPEEESKEILKCKLKTAEGELKEYEVLVYRDIAEWIRGSGKGELLIREIRDIYSGIMNSLGRLEGERARPDEEKLSEGAFLANGISFDYEKVINDPVLLDQYRSGSYERNRDLWLKRKKELGIVVNVILPNKNEVSLRHNYDLVKNLGDLVDNRIIADAQSDNPAVSDVLNGRDYIRVGHAGIGKGDGVFSALEYISLLQQEDGKKHLVILLDSDMNQIIIENGKPVAVVEGSLEQELGEGQVLINSATFAESFIREALFNGKLDAFQKANYSRVKFDEEKGEYIVYKGSSTQLFNDWLRRAGLHSAAYNGYSCSGEVAGTVDTLRNLNISSGFLRELGVPEEQLTGFNSIRGFSLEMNQITKLDLLRTTLLDKYMHFVDMGLHSHMADKRGKEGVPRLRGDVLVGGIYGIGEGIYEILENDELKSKLDSKTIKKAEEFLRRLFDMPYEHIHPNRPVVDLDLNGRNQASNFILLEDILWAA